MPAQIEFLICLHTIRITTVIVKPLLQFMSERHGFYYLIQVVSAAVVHIYSPEHRNSCEIIRLHDHLIDL